MTSKGTSQLAALDFGRYIERLTEDFTGREWIFDEIDDWLKPKRERFFILTGEPGIGKSAIAARLTQVRSDNIAAYHFCIAGNIGTITPNTVLRSLAAQLSDSLPDYGQALASTIKPHQVSINVDQQIGTVEAGAKVVGVIINHITASDPEEELDILLRAPLAELPVPPTPVLIMVDSLDEAVTHRGEVNLVTLLAKVGDLPPWVRFLCTSRPERRVLRYFDDQSPHVLAAESQMNLDDVQQYVVHRVAKERIQTQTREADVDPKALVERVTELADGNFLYVKILLNDVEAGRQPIDDLQALPKSLDEIYHGFLTRFTVGEWEDRYQPLMGVLAVAQEPLFEAQLAGFSGLRRTKVRQYLGVVQQFLDEREDEEGRKTYTLFHQSLRDYLLDEERSKGFWCAPEDGHKSIAARYGDFRDRWTRCDLYGLRHLPVHLMEAGERERLRTLLGDLEFLEAKTARVGADALLDDLGLALDLGSFEKRVRPSLLSLQRILSLESHNLRGWNQTAQPAFFAQQMCNRAKCANLPELETEAQERLEELSKPYLRLRWRAGRPYRALERTLTGHEGPVTTVTVTPDGQHVVSAGLDGTVKFWNLETGAERMTLRVRPPMHRLWPPTQDLAITPGGERLVVAENQNLRILDLNTEAEIMIGLGHDGSPKALELTDDGTLAVVGFDDGTLQVLDLQAGRERYRTHVGLDEHEGEITAVTVTPDSKWMCLGLRSWYGVIKVLDLQTGDEHWTLRGHMDSVLALTVTPDGRYLASGTWDGAITVWDLETGTEVRTLRDEIFRYFRSRHYGWVGALTTTVDGRQLVSGAQDGLVTIWDLATGKDVMTFYGHEEQVTALATTPDGSHVVSGSDDGTMRIWDLAAGGDPELGSPELGSWHDGSVYSVAITSDGKRALSGGGDSQIRIWDLETGEEASALWHNSASGVDSLTSVFALALSPDDRWLASGAQDGSLALWDLESGQDSEDSILGMPETMWWSWRHEATVMGLAMPDGRRIISGAWDGSIKVWDAQIGEVQMALRGHGREEAVRTLVVSPDGRRLVSGTSQGVVRVWDLKTGKTDVTAAKPGGWVHAVALSSAQTWVLSTVDDNTTLQVWDLETGTERLVLHGHVANVCGVAVTSDLQRAVSVGQDAVLKVWDLNTGGELATASLEGGLNCVAIAPDNVTIVAGSIGGVLYCLRYVEPDQ